MKCIFHRSLPTGTQEIAAGKTSAVIEIKPLGGLRGARKRLVKMSLLPNDAYTVGPTAAGRAKVRAVR